jgi:hypothetical protein
MRIRGSMPLTNGSGIGSGCGSGSLLFSSVISNMPTKNFFPAPGPARLVNDLQDANKIFKFFCLLLLESTFTTFSTIKSPRDLRLEKLRNSNNQIFFCLMIERSGSGSLPNGSGCGSGRPKNIWILRIRIRMRIRIRNTLRKEVEHS